MHMRVSGVQPDEMPGYEEAKAKYGFTFEFEKTPLSEETAGDVKNCDALILLTNCHVTEPVAKTLSEAGVKYLACIICGALAGMGGAYLTTCYSSTYTDGIVAGRGFIALAAVIFGRWSAGGILLACLFFGFCDALQIRLQVSGIAIPYQFFQMIPYVATVIVLSVIGTKQAGPKANGQPYRKEQR